MIVEPNVGRKSRLNPFRGELARSNSSRAAPRGKKLVQAPIGESVTLLQDFVHHSFRALVLNPGFSCVIGKSAVQRGSYQFGLYSEIGAMGATAGLARDLFDFVEEQDERDSGFSTFIACFEEPTGTNERDFEGLLWAQLQRLHEEDRRYHPWAPSVSSDPEDAKFAFSFAERAFFVIGLHSASSRFTRRFAWPTLVFNAHYQFEKLRENGQYARVREVIQSRERKLQGTLNPTLADFGTRSEASQYASRPVEKNWHCPFQAHGAEDQNEEARAPVNEREDQWKA